MTELNFTTITQNIFNEFDRQGLLLGLTRLEGEKNPEYKQRLLDVFVNRASATYRGLINGITRELGLRIIESINIRPIMDSNGDPLLPSPAAVFKETFCILYSDYANSTILQTIDRWEQADGAYTIQDLIDTINGTGYFTASIEDSDPYSRSMTIFNQSSVVTVTSEELSVGGTKVTLNNTNLIENTIAVRSQNLRDRVTSLNLLSRPGQYYIDLKLGILHTREAPAPGSFIRYQYRIDDFFPLASPVIIHNLQSLEFKTKMFEQVADILSEEANGLPTDLGAELINEILSVYATAFGR